MALVVGQRRGGTGTRGRKGRGQPLHPCVFVSFCSGAQGPHHGNGLKRAAGTEDVGAEESATDRETQGGNWRRGARDLAFPTLRSALLGPRDQPCSRRAHRRRAQGAGKRPRLRSPRRA